MWYTLRYEWGRRPVVAVAALVALAAVIALVVNLTGAVSPASNTPGVPANANPHQAAVNAAVFAEQEVGMTAERMIMHTPGSRLTAAQMALVLRDTPGAAGVYVISESPSEVIIGDRSAPGQPPLVCAALRAATLWNGVVTVPCPAP